MSSAKIKGECEPGTGVADKAASRNNDREEVVQSNPPTTRMGGGSQKDRVIGGKYL